MLVHFLSGDASAGQDDTNPALVWTVGHKGADRSAEVGRWVLAEVRVDELYSCGVDSDVNQDLNAVAGNLARFLPHAKNHAQFRLGGPPEPSERPVMIGVVHRRANKSGCVELVDGLHRVIALAEHGALTVRGLLAELKDAREPQRY